ncbi:MAG: PilZ domain-containing protein [Hyphomonas sp.]|nr:PilZ domain-containing protein [Hyphomonas sp.]
MSGPAAEAPRKFPRQRTLKGARIMCEGSLTFDVTIRDMSEGGVKLKLGSPFVVPPIFKLLILNPNTGIADTRACETRWQRGDQVGAHFIEALPEKSKPALQAPSLRRPPAAT